MTDSPDEARQHVMLDMAVMHNRIAFEADLQAARAVGLNLSSDTAALPSDEQRCRDPGMDGFLARPYMLAALHATVSAGLTTAGGQTPAMPAATPEADTPSIGLAVIEALRDTGENGSMHLARQVLSSFLATAERSVAQFDTVIGDGDAGAMGRVVDSLKSGAV